MNTADSLVRIVLVDDHQVVREGFKLLLMAHDEFEIVGEASNAQSLFKLLKTVDPDIIVLDIALPGMSGIDICKELKKENVDQPVLFLTANSTPYHLKGAIRSGADGFLPKDTSAEEFIHALKELTMGRSYFSDKISGLMIKLIADDNNGKKSEIPISLRELEVMKQIASGKSQKEIADELNISPRTVETHKKNIHSKLGLDTTVDLVKYAIREGITDL